MGIINPQEQNFHPAKYSMILKLVKYSEARSRGKLSKLENAPSCVLTLFCCAWIRRQMYNIKPIKLANFFIHNSFGSLELVLKIQNGVPKVLSLRYNKWMVKKPRNLLGVSPIHDLLSTCTETTQCYTIKIVKT